LHFKNLVTRWDLSKRFSRRGTYGRALLGARTLAFSALWWLAASKFNPSCWTVLHLLPEVLQEETKRMHLEEVQALYVVVSECKRLSQKVLTTTAQWLDDSVLN
jgi:hypothetical protein